MARIYDADEWVAYNKRNDDEKQIPNILKNKCLNLAPIMDL